MCTRDGQVWQLYYCTSYLRVHVKEVFDICTNSFNSAQRLKQFVSTCLTCIKLWFETNYFPLRTMKLYFVPCKALHKVMLLRYNFFFFRYFISTSVIFWTTRRRSLVSTERGSRLSWQRTLFGSLSEDLTKHLNTNSSESESLLFHLTFISSSVFDYDLLQHTLYLFNNLDLECRLIELSIYKVIIAHNFIIITFWMWIFIIFRILSGKGM